MKTGFVVLVTFLVGCAAKQETPPWNQPRAWAPNSEANYSPSNYPDDAEQFLTDAQKSDLAKLRATLHPLPPKNPFQSDPDLGIIYTNWYSRGYTFALATGMQTLRPQDVIDHSPKGHAKIQGWEDGNAEGKAKWLQEQLTRAFHTQLPDVTNAPSQGRSP